MISLHHFGNMPDGQEVMRYRLRNQQGMCVDILSLGAIIQRWCMPDKDATDIVLGFDDLQGYLTDDSYIGATVGRYANRIAKGKFCLNQHNYELSVNLQGNTLHGGGDNFSNRLWQAHIIRDGEDPCVQLSLLSEDGDQGFPGNIEVKVAFTLTEQNCLRVEYSAISDKDTVFNPTQHSYFNLAGHQSGEVRKQRLGVFADYYTPADNTGIPTGEICPVEGTSFDLRETRPIGEYLQKGETDLRPTSGLDHNWCLNMEQKDNAAQKVAIAIEPTSGRSMEVKTSMPGMQVYTANFLPTGLKGKCGAQYGPYHAFCLETQFYPDSPNKPHFPSATLEAGKTFYAVTEYCQTI